MSLSRIRDFSHRTERSENTQTHTQTHTHIHTDTHTAFHIHQMLADPHAKGDTYNSVTGVHADVVSLLLLTPQHIFKNTYAYNNYHSHKDPQLTYTHTLSHTHNHSLSDTHTHTHTHTHAHTHTHIHTHTHTHTHSPDIVSGRQTSSDT